MKSSRLYIALSFLSILFFLSCKKDQENVAVIVSEISPGTGPYSTIVTITGSGFNPIPANNTVKFNGTAAQVQSASNTQLVVVVPKAAGTGPVSVQNVVGPIFNFISTITVSTLAGNSSPGFADGDGVSAQFNYPIGVAVDAGGNVYVGDYNNHRLRKSTPLGTVSTIAGNGIFGYADGNGTAAQFNYPMGVVVDANENIYVGDRRNHRIRKISPAGVVSTIAGSGVAGFADGNGATAQFSEPSGVAVDRNGNVYVADKDNHRVRKITPAGVVSTLAGSGSAGFADGEATIAEFNHPDGITVDANGNVFVTDFENNRIRKITPNGMVSTIAGNGTPGFADGEAATAQFDHPVGIALDANGNLYVAGFYDNRIRKIAAVGGLVSTLAGNGTDGYVDGSGTSAQFFYPTGVAVDASGIIYVSDGYNHRIRKITVE